MIRLKKSRKKFLLLPLIYLAYSILFGALAFLYRVPWFQARVDLKKYREEEDRREKVALVEDGYESFLTRIKMIRESRETLDIAYYTMHDGYTTRVFLGEILEAADRGVEVRILLDGVFHNLDDELEPLIDIFQKHPNIDLKFYEPFKLLAPYTWNNRLHDKFIIKDGEMFLTGGRNIGDKYFLEDYDKKVYDRDLLILENGQEGSVVEDLRDYFERLWAYENSHEARPKVRRGSLDKFKGLRELLRSSSEDFKEDLDLVYNFHNVDNIHLVHNSLDRGNKYPEILELLAELSYDSNRIYMQSPYIIPTRGIMKNINLDKINPENIEIYTNSLYSSPNPFASSGYIKARKDLVDRGIDLYEYQGDESIHGKSYIFDDISMVGSFNLDYRSSYLSTETMVVIKSSNFQEELLGKIIKSEDSFSKVNKNYDYDGDSSKKAGFFKTLLIRFLSIFANIFKFML